MRRWRDRAGLTLALGIAAAALFAVEVSLGSASWTVGSAAAAALGIAAVGLAVVLAPRAPILALVVFGAGYVAQTAATGLVDSVVVLAVWTGLLVMVALHRPLRQALIGAAVGLAPIAVFAVASAGDDVRAGPSTVALWAVPWVAGRTLRGRNARHTAEVALLQAEKERLAAEERVRLAEERATLARDVHDLLGHALTTVVVQARAAAAELPDDASAATAALKSVDDVASDALTQLRALVGALRSPEAPTVQSQPGLAELPAMIARMPLRVTLDMDPALLASDDELQHCLFRIVQESLTNAVRHSAADDVVVRLETDGTDVRVLVADPGPRRERADGGGHGLAGIRERVRAYGGRVDACPQGAGFEVRAILPRVAVA